MNSASATDAVFEDDHFSETLAIHSRQRPLSVVTIARNVLIILIRKPNTETTVFHGEPKRKILSTRLNSHPPLVMVHLFQMQGSDSGDDLVKSKFSIFQPPLGI